MLFCNVFVDGGIFITLHKSLEIYKSGFYITMTLNNLPYMLHDLVTLTVWPEMPGVYCTSYDQFVHQISLSLNYVYLFLTVELWSSNLTIICNVNHVTSHPVSRDLL